MVPVIIGIKILEFLFFCIFLQAIEILRNSQGSVRLKVRKCHLENVPDNIPPGQGQISLANTPGKIVVFDRYLVFIYQCNITKTHLITKTYLYNFDPLKPHFYIVKLGFTFFFLFLLKT